MDRPFGALKPALITAMQQATASWSDVIGVRFYYLSAEDSRCTNTNNSVLFNVRLVNANYNAVAFFPDAPRSQRELLVDDVAFTTNAGGRDLQGILRHELGHVLGFRHEHIHINCPYTSEGPAESRQLTSYDVNSVMHYPQCRPSGTGGYRQTQLDYDGAISLYGTSLSAPAARPDSGFASFFLSGDRSRVYYTGVNNHVYELWWTGSGWGSTRPGS